MDIKHGIEGSENFPTQRLIGQSTGENDVANIILTVYPIKGQSIM